MIYLGFDYMVWIVYLFFSGLFGAQVWGMLSHKKPQCLNTSPDGIHRSMLNIGALGKVKL